MIKATLYMEAEPHLLDEPMAVAVIKRAFEIEAEKHGYALDGDMQVAEGPRPGVILLVQELKDRA